MRHLINPKSAALDRFVRVHFDEIVFDYYWIDIQCPGGRRFDGVAGDIK
jgi:hypothetical protein